MILAQDALVGDVALSAIDQVLSSRISWAAIAALPSPSLLPSAAEVVVAIRESGGVERVGRGAEAARDGGVDGNGCCSGGVGCC